MSSVSNATANMGLKDKNMFNQMLQLYDDKQLKPALRNADLLLEKYPDHPETNSMKALIMSTQGRHAEAQAQVKKVLFKNLSNFTCWHVYGIINRKEKDYDQARRCFLNAVKYNAGSNDSIYRDLSQLQAHLRDYEGLKETRRQLLLKNPGEFETWVSYAASCYMANDFDNSISSCDSIIKFNDTMKTPMKPPQMMEIIMLKVKSLENKNQIKEAITYMIEKKNLIVDKVQYFDTMGRLRQKNGQNTKSVENYEQLLQLNSVNFDTYYKILGVRGVKLFDREGNKLKLSEDDRKIVKQTLDYYAQGFPKVDSHQRIGMKFLQGQDFVQLMKRYAKSMLVKGAPALMQDMREFYEDQDKVKQIEDVLIGWLDMMDKQMTLEQEDEQEQDPTVQLWLLFFISSHFLWKRQYDQALKFINRAISHTPTLLDLYTLKGRIYQKAGNLKRAAQLFEEARLMDTADRAINAQSAVYAAKSGDVDRGQQIIEIFFKDCGYESSVHDNQCIWFEQTCGQALLKNRDYRRSLKQLNYVIYHLTNMVDDQYDYYLYSIRKFTLTAFEGLMKFNDNKLYQYKPIIKATVNLIRLVSRVEKEKDQEQKKFVPDHEEYLNSERYKDLQKQISDAVVDEEEYKKDTDPEGYQLYSDLLSGKFDCSNFVANVARINPKEHGLQAKALGFFARKGKFSNVYDCIKRLVSDGVMSSHPKATLAAQRAQDMWKGMDDNARFLALGKSKERVDEASIFFDKLTKLNQVRDLCKHSILAYELEHYKTVNNSTPEQELIVALKQGPQIVLRFKSVLKAAAFLNKRGCGQKFNEIAKDRWQLAQFN